MDTPPIEAVENNAGGSGPGATKLEEIKKHHAPLQQPPMPQVNEALLSAQTAHYTDPNGLSQPMQQPKPVRKVPGRIDWDRLRQQLEQEKRKVEVNRTAAIASSWKAAIDPASGRVFYWNSFTGETSWNPPR